MKNKSENDRLDHSKGLNKKDENVGSATRNGQLQADNEVDEQTDSHHSGIGKDGYQSRLIKTDPKRQAFENTGPKKSN